MGSLSASIPVGKIKRLQIYINSGYKSLATIMKETGASYAINGGLYDMSKFTACCQVKADGKIYANDGYNYCGIAWNTPSDIAWKVMPRDCGAIANYIACVEMIANSKVTMDSKVDSNSALGGSRPRSAFGYKNGEVQMFCTSSGMKPSTLANYCRNTLGWEFGIMLDGGGSSQCNFNGKCITSSRKVQNLILVYLNDGGGATTPPPSTPTTDNPYPVPTRTLKYGTTGSDVKWAQFQLNKVGAGLTVDGSFGPAMKTAVLAFQKANGLSQDALIGPATREELKTAEATGTDLKPSTPSSTNPYPVPTTTLKRGMAGTSVKWLQYQLNKAGFKCDIDGSFGPGCQTAVMNFQRAKGLDVDGSVGPATRAALKAI